MPLLSVISDTPGAGKTGVAAAVARDLAYTGRRVWLVRGEGDGNAAADAHWFATLEFAPGSASTPVAPGVIPPPSGDEIVVAELDAPLERADATILVTRGLPDEARVTEVAPAAVVALDVPLSALAGAPEEVGGAALVAIAEDRTLAGFSVSEAQAALRAETLVEGDGLDLTCDHLVIAPIGSDAGQPYLSRFESKAVVVRFDKTDQHLAASSRRPRAGLPHPDGRRTVIATQRVPVSSSCRLRAAAWARHALAHWVADTENTVIALEGIAVRPTCPRASTGSASWSGCKHRKGGAGGDARRL